MSSPILKSSSPKKPDYVAAAAEIPDYRGPYQDPWVYTEFSTDDEEDVDDTDSANADDPSPKPTMSSQNSIVVISKVKAKAVVNSSATKSTNHVDSGGSGAGTKSTSSPFSCSKITGIVPSDKVESILETMFESDSVSTPPPPPPTPVSTAPVSAPFCRTVSDLVGESVEKLLKSPSPSPAAISGRPLSNGVCDGGAASVVGRNSAGKKWNNTPDKNKENSLPHSNGRVQTVKSQLELALTSNLDTSKCDKSNVGNKSANVNRKISYTKDGEKEVSKEETYVEVESELAKMFAGIDDSETAVMKKSLIAAGNTSATTASKIANNLLPNSNDSLSILPHSSGSHMPSSTTDSISSNTKKNVPRKRTRKPKTSTASSTKHSKTKQLSGKDNSAFDSVISKRVPVIHIEGPKENPVSVQIINSIRTEDEDLSENKTATKRKSGKSDRPTKKSATDYVLKNYDPSSSDSSWVCVFCKSCAFVMTEYGEQLGDLFGPYFIRIPSKPPSESHPDQEPAQKKQRVESACSDTAVSEEKSLEVWAHENCIVWAAGVHLVGSKLMGLEEAVYHSLAQDCTRCKEGGANIGCRVPNCKSVMHYGCAVFSNWKLDSEKFLSLCNLHAGPD